MNAAFEDGDNQISSDLKLCQKVDMAIAQTRIVDIRNSLNPAQMIFGGIAIAKTVVVDVRSDRLRETRTHIFRNHLSVIVTRVRHKAKDGHAIGTEQSPYFRCGGGKDGFDIQGFPDFGDNTE